MLFRSLGGLNDALEYAASKAGLTTYNVRTYPTQPDFFEQLLQMTSQDMVKTYIENSKFKDLFNQAEYIERLSEDSFLQARLPYILNFQ